MSNYAQRPGNRPPQRRKKKSSAAPVFMIGLMIVLIVLAVIFIPKLMGGNDTPDPNTVNNEIVQGTDAPDAQGNENTGNTASITDIATLLANSEMVVAPLDDSQRVKISAEELSVTPGLPDEWRNILLLGSDGHTAIESARTDTMMVCSINTRTGEIKLCSIQRDLMVEIPDRGNYKINSANFWGGPWLAVKLVNEYFDMNIEDYVMVNFFGFQTIANYLGGIEMDITKEEMEQIERNVSEQIRLGREAGIDESDLPMEHLTTYGENTHLDARQTLGYARIRKLAGADIERANRQRKVLAALLEKMMGTSPLEITRMAANLFEYFSTSMTAAEAIELANFILSSNMVEIETKYLPVNGTYALDTRNNISAMYDVDYKTNATALYDFIYGQ